MIAREEWLRCQHDASPMFDIRGSTPVWAQCIYYFLVFKYKNLCICLLVSKSICSIKEHWWFLILFWPNEVQRMFLTAHKLLNVKLIPQTVFMKFYKIDITFTLSCFIYYMKCISYTSRLLSYEISLFIYLYSSFI